MIVPTYETTSKEQELIISKLKEENQKYKEVIDKISKILHEIDESIKATGGYVSNYMDELLDILKEGIDKEVE